MISPADMFCEACGSTWNPLHKKNATESLYRSKKKCPHCGYDHPVPLSTRANMKAPTMVSQPFDPVITRLLRSFEKSAKPR